MADHPQAVFLFHASSHALRAEKLVQQEGIACRLVPVPRHLSSDCGVCLRLALADAERAGRILTAQRVEVAAVHPV